MLIDVCSFGFEGDINGVYVYKYFLILEYFCYFLFDVGMEIFDELMMVNWEGLNNEKKVEQVEDKMLENFCIIDNFIWLLLKFFNGVCVVVFLVFVFDIVVGCVFVKMLEEVVENIGRFFILVILDCVFFECI